MPQFRQANDGFANEAINFKLSVPFNLNVLQGSLLFAIAARGGQPVSIQDSLSNVYNQIGTIQNGGIENVGLWMAVSQAAGSCTVTATYSTNTAGNDPVLAIAEYSLKNISLDDFGEVNSGGIPTTVLSITKTFSNPNLVLFWLELAPNAQSDIITPLNGLTLDYFGSSNLVSPPIFCSKAATGTTQTAGVQTTGGRDAAAWLVGFDIPTVDLTYRADMVVKKDISLTYQADIFVFIQMYDLTFSADMSVLTSGSLTFSADMYIQGGVSHRTIVRQHQMNRQIVTDLQMDIGE